MFKWLLFFLMFAVVTVRAQSQAEFDISLYRHTITYTDFKATFQVKELTIPLKQLAPSKNYHWYKNNTIQTTQGGYQGKLLDGLYSAYFLNGNLKEQGSYERGLKEGLWNRWDEQGLLLSKMNFREGVLHGEFSTYGKGKLVEAGQYREGKLEGLLKKYGVDDSLTVSRYKNGKPLEPVKKIKWLKNIFTKKTS